MDNPNVISLKEALRQFWRGIEEERMLQSQEICKECGRPAHWFWPGNGFMGSRFLCGYHKRAFRKLFRLEEDKNARTAQP